MKEKCNHCTEQLSTKNQETNPAWQRPVVTTIDIKRTLAGAASGADGTLHTTT